VRDDALLPLRSVMATGGFGGPLATGTPPMVAMGLGEAPPVVGLVQKCSGGLSDGSSKANAVALFLVEKTITREGGGYIGKTLGVWRVGSLTDSILT
jgi:hypothetical protein